MIKEIYCPAFKQQKVVFNEGLNVILGDDRGANSIGKSTMLLVIDYMLGGEHYQEKEEIISHVGHHLVGACFEFKEELFYFIRETKRTDTVFKCDNQYNVLSNGELTLDEYKSFLQEKYNLKLSGCTLRTFVGLFDRIYDRENYNEKLPLNEHSDSSEASVERLVKIFDYYSQVEGLKKNLKDLSERNKAYNKVIKLDLINSAKNKKEAQEIQKRIDSIQQDVQILSHEILTNTVDLDVVQLQRVYEIKEELARIQKIKARIRSQIVRFQNDAETTRKAVTIDLSLLKKFFPQANVLEISKINQFHDGLCKVMADDLNTHIIGLQARYERVDEEERLLLTSMKNVVAENNPTKIAIDNLAAKQKELFTLLGATTSFEKKKSYQKEKDDAQKLYDETLQKILTGIQQLLNTKITEFNDFVYSNTKKEPLLTLQPSRYIYDCPDDGGTGSRFSSLVLFDLAILSSTKLPVVCHDSLILKNIEDNAIDKIFELYNKFTNKQIFIAFDKKTAYNQDTQKILEDNKVLELAPGGYELYGKSWSRY